MPVASSVPNVPRLLPALLDLGLAVVLPLSTQLAAVTGKGRTEVQQASDTEGPITPVTGAFVIWAPIFACLLAYGVLRTRFRHEFVDQQGEVLLRVSLVGNILWSLNAQFRDFGWQSLALIAASVASATGSVARYARLGENNQLARVASYLLAPFAGWLSVATFANLDTTQRLKQPTGQDALSPPVILALASTATVAGVAATRGNWLYSTAAAWGLGGIALKNARRDPKLAATAFAGIAAMTAATIIVAKRR